MAAGGRVIMTDDTRLGGPTTVGARSPMRPLADGTIRSRVEAALAWEPGLRAGAVNVSVEDAVITLRGVMPTFAQKQAAERVSRSVCGVADVSNALGVRLAIAHTRSDEDLESAVVAALRWSASLPAHRIGVGVKNGVVTLRGTVACQREKDAASRLVEDLIGVRDVANEIVVAPDRDAGNLIPAIEAALWRAAVVDPRQIRVRAADGCVVLTGQVRSWAEREEAERQAWAAPGVRQVDDQIRVLPVERRERE